MVGLEGFFLVLGLGVGCGLMLCAAGGVDGCLRAGIVVFQVAPSKEQGEERDDESRKVGVGKVSEKGLVMLDVGGGWIRCGGMGLWLGEVTRGCCVGDSGGYG